MADLRQILDQARNGRPLLMVVPGSGLIARCAVESGVDALMVLNARVYRSLGSGALAACLPYGHANDQTEELLREQVLPRSGDLPMIAGVFGVDPTCPLRDRRHRLQDMGVTGVVNWPAVGFIDGEFRRLGIRTIARAGRRHHDAASIQRSRRQFPAHGNKAQAAAALNVARKTLYRWLSQDPADFSTTQSERGANRKSPRGKLRRLGRLRLGRSCALP